MKGASDREFYNCIKGPDFPTGGIITDDDSFIKKVMKDGNGSFTLRSRIISEKSKRPTLVVAEIPYQSNKAKIIEKIAECVKNKKIKDITEIRDESNKDGVRIVIELKYSADEEEVAGQLFRYTPLQTTISSNNLVIVDGRPKVLSIRELIDEFIKFRRIVVIKRTEFDLRKHEEHAHILEGLIKATKNIDEIIKIIRTCTKEEGPKNELMKSFELSEKQAQSILDMKLAKLSKFEYKKLSDEYEKTKEDIRSLKKIIDDEQERDSVIIEELKEISKQYGRDRLTQIGDDEDE
jgi:DNA gyrase subunit A